MMNRVNSNTIPPVADRSLPGKGKRGFKRWFLGIATLFGIVLVGCSQGPIPLISSMSSTTSSRTAPRSHPG
jgi:uncharacterized membrane protein YraQ (UPF0718 family)